MFNSIAKKDIDLLAAYNRKTGPSPYASIIKLTVLPLCLVLIIGSVFVFQKVRIASIDDNIIETDKEIKDYNKKIASMGSDAYDLYNEMANKNSKIESVINNINSYPRLTTESMNIFINNLYNGLSMSAISYSDGVVSISATATNVLTIEDYVRKLRNSKLFMDVSYTGYQSSETSTTVSSDEVDEDVTVTSKVYAFQVNCVLKGVSN